MILLTDARILPMDDAMTEIQKGWIAIEGTTIRAMGEGTPPHDLIQPGQGVVLHSMEGDLILPGMVNASARLDATVLRGLGAGRRLADHGQDLPFDDHLEASAELGALELLTGGVTTVADIAEDAGAVAPVLDRAGLRAVIGQRIGHGSDAQADLAQARDLAQRLHAHPRLAVSLALGAMHEAGPALIEQAAATLAETGMALQMPLAASLREAAWAGGQGGTPVEIAARAGLLVRGLLASDAVHVNPEDIARMAEAGIGVAQLPLHAMMAGPAVAPAPAYRARGIAVGLGTGTAAHGHRLDVFSACGPAAMALVAAEAEAGTTLATACHAALHMATLGGARALGLGDRIGSLEPGKQADLIRIRLRTPRQLPLHDICATLVLSTLPCDVTGSMVAGDWLLEAGVPTRLDAARIVRRADEMAERIAVLIASRSAVSQGRARRAQAAAGHA